MAEPDQSKNDFAQLVMARLRETGVSGEISYDADDGPSAAQEQAQYPPDPSKARGQTLIARFPGLTSWSDYPVPLTGVLARDIYADGHEQSWLVVTTATQ